MEPKLTESAFQVFVRIRPPIRTAAESGKSRSQLNILYTKDNEVIVRDPYDAEDLSVFSSLKLILTLTQKGRAYNFDYVFAEKHNNRAVFERTIMPLVPHILGGVNATCFAYGVTGAGKTHTMLGDLYNTATGEAGICSMAVEAIFAAMEDCAYATQSLKLSYLEIYNEQVIDLLGSSNSGLMIVEDPGKGVAVPGLAEYEVKSSKELIRLMLQGNQRRTMAETSMNQFSSRSHAILQLSIEYQTKGEKGKDELVTAKLSLVDLAGSERAATTENRGLRMLEGGKINRSLLALGNCINILSDKAKSGLSFVPYRDSKLTRLLKDSLGGNTKTVMVACIVSSRSAYEETLNTLKYAERAKRIRKKVNRNIKEVELDASQYKEIIENLKAEIEALKEHALRAQVTCSVKGEDIKLLDKEILTTKAVKQRLGEELDREGSGVTKSLQLPLPHEDDAYLCKLSQELLSKYEEHYEMKQSVHELTELNKKNFALLVEHQKRMDELVKAKIADDVLPLNAERIEKLIEQKSKEIDSLQAIIDNNEHVKKQIEESLKINTMMQKKYFALVVKLQSHKKKDILDLQIATRTLRMEKMDLIMQNLEVKKAAKIAAIANQGKDRQIAEMKRQIDEIKQKLEQKERQLEASAAQIQRQNNELIRLRKARPEPGWKKHVSPKGCPTGFSFATPAEPPHKIATITGGKKKGLACSLPPSPSSKKNPVQKLDFSPDLEASFISLSSVSANVENLEEASKSDIELANTCTDALGRGKGVAPKSQGTEQIYRSGSIVNPPSRVFHEKRGSVTGSQTKKPEGFFSSVNNNYAKAITRLAPKRGSTGKDEKLDKSHVISSKQQLKPTALGSTKDRTTISKLSDTLGRSICLDPQPEPSSAIKVGTGDARRIEIINLYNITNIQSAGKVNIVASTKNLEYFAMGDLGKKRETAKKVQDNPKRPHMMPGKGGFSQRIAG